MLCPDPYGSQVSGPWIVVSNTCVKSITNPTNVESPVSPISPLNPTSQLAQVTTAPLIPPEPVIAQELTALQTTVETPATSVATVQVKDTTTTSDTVKPEPKVSNSAGEVKIDIKSPEVPKGKDLVPGFGLVMSLNLINQSYNMQQQQIEETIRLEQEQEYGRTQEFTLTLLTETTIGDRFDSLNRNRWASLLRNHPLQRLELDD